MDIKNETIRKHAFLREMFDDDYFPAPLVEKGRDILLRLCGSIESATPDSEQGLYVLTHAATDEFNALAMEFEDHDSEIETAARECIAADFEFIARAYGFADADVEELIATRDW